MKRTEEQCRKAREERKAWEAEQHAKACAMRDRVDAATKTIYEQP